MLTNKENSHNDVASPAGTRRKRLGLASGASRVTRHKFKLTTEICNNLELGNSSFRLETLINLQATMKERVTPTVLSRAVEALMMCVRDVDFHVVGHGLSCLQLLLTIQLASSSRSSAASLLNQLLPSHRRRDVVARLGHAKSSVRSKALDVLVYAASVSREFQAGLFVEHCNDNNWLVRLHMVQFLTETLAKRTFETTTIVVELCTPILTVLMDDRKREVREAAIDALVVLSQCDEDGVLLPTLRSLEKSGELKKNSLLLLFNRFGSGGSGGSGGGGGGGSGEENNGGEYERGAREQTTGERSRIVAANGAASGKRRRRALGDEVQRTSGTFEKKMSLSTPQTSKREKKKSTKSKSVFGPGSPTGDEPFALPLECEIVHVQGPEKIHQEIDDMETKLLSDLKAIDWEERIRAMRRLQGILLGGGGGGGSGSGSNSAAAAAPTENDIVSCPGMDKRWKTIVEGLVLQLSDLRSKVVRQACAAVATLASTLGSTFSSYVELVLPKLLLLTSQAKMVMSCSADLCIKYLIGSNGRSGHPKMLHLLVGATERRKNRDATRSHGQQYLRLALSTWTKRACNKESTSIRHSIVGSLKDPNVEVREAARWTYWSYHVHWSEESALILKSLSTAETNRLFEAKPTSEMRRVEDDVRLVECDVIKQQLRFVDAAAATAAAAAAAAAAVAAAREPETGGERSGASGGEIEEMGTTFHTRREVTRRRVTEERTKEKTEEEKSSTTAATFVMRSMEPPSTASIAKMSGLSQRPTRKAPSSTGFHTSRSSPSSGQPVRQMTQGRSSVVVSNSTTKNTVNNEKYHARYSQSKKQEVTDKGDERRKEEGSEEVEEDSASMERRHAQVTPLPSSSNKPSSHVVVQREEHHAFPSSSITNVSTTLQSLLDKMRGTNAADWKTRISAFDNVTRWIDEHARSLTLDGSGDRGSNHLVSLKYERIVKMFVTSIPDAHHKVTLSALLALQRLLRLGGPSNTLPLLLSHVFQTLVDPRDTLRDASNVVLSLMLKTYDPSDVVLMLVTLLDHTSQRTRLGCMEFFLHLIPMAGRTLFRPSVMRQAVHKTCETMTSTNSEVRKLSMKVLVGLHQVSTDSFLTQLRTIHSRLREQVIKALANQIPRLKQAMTSNARASSSSTRIVQFAAPPPPSRSSGHRPPLPPPSMESPSDPHPSRRREGRRTSPAHRGSGGGGGSSGGSGGSGSGSSSSRNSTPHAIMARHDVSDILTALSSSTLSSIARGLVRVSQLARTVSDNTEWACLFPQLVIAVVSTLKSVESSTRVHGLLALRTMLETHPEPFNGLTDVVLRSTLDACRDDVADVLSSATETLQLMASSLNCTSCAKSLLSILRSLDGKDDRVMENMCVRKMCLLTMGMFVPNMSSATVYNALDDLMPPIVASMSSPSSAIRKEGVFLFVKIYSSVGDAHVRPYMEKLSVSQQKLVTIYIRRSTKTSN